MAKYVSEQKIKYQKSDEIINFGYVKGMTISDVINKEAGFIEWAKRSVKGFRLSKEIIKEHNIDPVTYKKL